MSVRAVDPSLETFRRVRDTWFKYRDEAGLRIIKRAIQRELSKEDVLLLTVEGCHPYSVTEKSLKIVEGILQEVFPAGHFPVTDLESYEKACDWCRSSLALGASDIDLREFKDLFHEIGQTGIPWFPPFGRHSYAFYPDGKIRVWDLGREIENTEEFLELWDRL